MGPLPWIELKAKYTYSNSEGATSSPAPWRNHRPRLALHNNAARRDPYRVRRLDAEVWNIAQGVVEAVGEIGGADHQRQFHDLPFIVELSQFFERTGANGGGAAGDALSVEDSGLILFVKQRTAFVELQRLDLLAGDADSLRRSDVRARSILAAV